MLDACWSSIAIAQQRSRSRGCASLGSESRSASIRQILDRVADRWSLLVVAVLDHRTMRYPEPPAPADDRPKVSNPTRWS